MSPSILASLVLIFVFSASAHAEMAPPLKAMLDTALASGTDADVDTVVKYLKKTDPADSKAIDAIVADHRARVAASKQQNLAHQTVLEGWTGSGQIGFSQTSGNTDTLNLTAGLNLTREGLRLRQNLHALVDYQRVDGVIPRR